MTYALAIVAGVSAAMSLFIVASLVIGEAEDAREDDAYSVEHGDVVEVPSVPHARGDTP